MWRLFKLIYEEVKNIKEDACIMGCTGHPYFSQYQDLVRTYDVPADYLSHRNRGLMIRHTTPGVLVSYDMHGHKEKFAEYIDMVISDCIPPQIGSIMWFSGGNQSCGDAEYNLIRRLKDTFPRGG